MKQYRGEIEVTTKRIVKLHAEDEHDAAERFGNLDLDEIEAMGEFGTLLNVEVGYIEDAVEEDDDDE